MKDRGDLWRAVYAAEFVRALSFRCTDLDEYGRMMYDAEDIEQAQLEAFVLADLHEDVAKKKHAALFGVKKR